MKNAQTETSIKSKSSSKKSVVLIVCLVIATALLTGIGVWYYKDSLVKHTITVTGKSQMSVKNQVADFSLNIEATNEDKSKAVQEVSTKASDAVKQITEFGVPSEDVQTRSLNVYQREEPYIEGGVTKYKKGDWTAAYTVAVTLRDVSKAADLTKILSGVENASMWGPNLRVDNAAIDEDTLLQEAVADARSKAESMAKNSGRKVGKVADIIEGSTPSTIRYPLVDKAAVEIGGGSAVPIEPGSSDVYKTVTVTFYLK